jgi:pimeloyl-ACP methyl ester carboxylesterase
MRRPSLVLALMLPALLLAVAYASPTVAGQAQAPAQSSLQWGACDDIPGDAQCAFIQVPVDYSHPDGATFSLRIGRLPSTDPAHKRGSVLIIPGGPGPGIKDMLINNGPDPELRQYYDVVSFDPRGIEESSPLRCDPALVPPVIAPIDRAPTREEFDAITNANAAFFQSCMNLTGDLMSHLSVKDTAGDIERIRIAIGQTDGLVAYGGSLGSIYGTAYLERYGDHVKTLAIDGVVDHSVDWATIVSRNDISVQQSFDRFVRWCAGEPACALHGQDVYAAYDAAVAAQPAVRKLAAQFLAAGRDPNVGWPLIARLLADVSAGDTTTLDQLNSAGSLASASQDPLVQAGKQAIIQGVYCGTFGPDNDYDALLDTYTDVARQAPRFAWKFWVATPLELASAGTAMCAGWPNEASDPPHQLQIGPQPNVLVATATYDPPTPLVSALSVWQQIPEAKLFIADTDGHQSMLVSRCAFEYIRDFLLDPASAQPVDVCPLGAGSSAPDGGGPTAIADQI